MPVDYDSIRRENRRKYGEEIGRIGSMLLSERYDDRTHFIFEILQNAEDALKKRGDWYGPRAVKFSLFNYSLTISHFGKPFDEADVRGVCGIGESTKKLTDIGRFGIGFKSVYAFTDNPEIHSGQEHFAIESYVWPKAVRERSLKPEETKIHIPFKRNEPNEPLAKDDILEGLQRLGPRTLLFLREIEEISWSVVNGPSGCYQRSKPKFLGDEVRKVRVVGQDNASDEVEEGWIVFSREVFNEGTSAGHVEIAFQLRQSSASRQNSSLRRVDDSRLVVFFPTVLPTYLGFVVQGPYRTTPSRDNVPQNDRWNRHLIQETAVLLVDALEELRELGLLNISTLQCLPLNAHLFDEKSRFAPLFQAVKEALKTKPLLPAYRGGHIAAQNGKLARTQDLRALISPDQLVNLFPSDDNPVWLSDSITADRTPSLRRYITGELAVDEVAPEWLVPRLTATFLEAQSDEWIERLYVFLNSQRALLQRLQRMPLARLENGSHTVAFSDGKPQAYLPGNTKTGFPTVKRSVCQSREARSFLESLGLRVPDPVDDVITNILPKYGKDQVDIPDREYQSDIERVLTAYDTDSTAQRSNLLSALREAKFIVAADTGNGVSQFVRPSETYLATERLTGLFEGVPGVLLVDNSRECLRGERIRDLLRATGTPEYLAPTQVEPSLTQEDKEEFRRRYGDTRYSSERPVEDYTLMGLDSLLSVLASLPVEQASKRASLLWDALRDVQQRRGNAAFYGHYRWFYYTNRDAMFPARFIQTLNEATWIPDKNGVLRPPSSIVFEDTGWEEDLTLAAKIQFMPGTLRELANETGIELEALDLLKKLGCTSEAELKKRLGIVDDSSGDAISTDSTQNTHGRSHDSEAEPTAPATDQIHSTLDVEDADGHGGRPSSSKRSTTPDATSETQQSGTASAGQQNRANSSTTQSGSGQGGRSGGGREFVSYIAVSPDEASENPEGLTHQERMSLEEQAIELVLSKEPTLQRTPPNNPGFDLYELGPNGEAVRWVEVKSMKSTLSDHPVGLSSTQFESAQKYQDAYWLYIVENAGNPEQSHIIRIKDPAGKAQTFTFDHGWVAVSEDLD